MNTNYSLIITAINSENVDLLKELLQQENDFSPQFSYLADAFRTGNIEIVQALLEKCPYWPIHFKHTFRDNPMHLILDSDYDEAKKLQTIQILLPYIYTEDLKRPGFYKISDQFRIIFKLCMKRQFILMEFFINEFYAEKYNSLYPLMKRLEAAVDESHHIAIHLHDEIKDINDYTKMIDRRSYRLRYFFYREHVAKIAETFLKLLLQNTRESMQLAVEIFQVLLGQRISGIFELHSHDDVHFHDISMVKGNLKIQQALEDPTLRKILFRLIYNTISAKKDYIYDFIFGWLEEGLTRGEEMYKWSKEFLDPFFIKPLYKKIYPERLSEFLWLTTSDENTPRSLKELSRDVIRCKVYQHVDEDVKKFMDHIWSLNLPTTVKCFLLHIPDPSWMDD